MFKINTIILKNLYNIHGTRKNLKNDIKPFKKQKPGWRDDSVAKSSD